VKNNKDILVWYWGQRGGGASYSQYLAHGLRADPRVGTVKMALSACNELLPQITASGFACMLEQPAWIGSLWSISPWERLRRFGKHLQFPFTVRRQKYAALIIGMNFPLAWPLVYLVRTRDTRVTYVCHDARPHPGDYQIFWQTVSQWLLLRSVDHIMVLSSVVRDRLLKQGIAPGKITLAPIAVLSPDIGQGAVTPALRVVSAKGSPLRLLFLGRLIAYKGLDLLAEVVEHLDKRDDWRLAIAGAGPLEASVAAQFAGHPRISLELGWIAPERFAAIILEHDVLLCPYTEASQSGVIPEAARCGVPAVVTPHAGLIEQVENKKAGVVAGDTTGVAFAAAITRLIDDRDLVSQMGQFAALPPRDGLLADAIGLILPPRE
jgi:glycosyltransferase involved in cell wall biosynthesis